MVKYKIKGKKGDPATTLLEVSGKVEELTLGDYNDAIKSNTKSITEVAQQVAIEKAKMVNVLRSHPEVKTADTKFRVACAIYELASSTVKGGKAKLTELRKQVARDQKEMAEISKQTGLVLVSVDKKK